MAVDMLMPKMGESIAEATIVKWVKNVGDTVKKDEVVLEISTDKVDSEVPAPASGTLTEVLFGEDDTVEVGTIIARIGGEGEAPAPASEEETPPHFNPPPAIEEAPKAAPAATHTPSASGETPVGRTDGKRFYSPVVRSMAKEHGVSLEELSGLPGSGKDGRVNKKDFEAYLANRSTASAPSTSARVTADRPATAKPALGETKTLEQLGLDPSRVEVIKMNAMRKAIAKGMKNTIDTAAHVQQVHEADITRIVKFREGIKRLFKEKYGFNLTYTAFMIEAACRALEQFPMVNSMINGDEIILKNYVNFGMAVALDDGGLIVPNIKNCQDLNLVGIARAVADLGVRARNGELTPEDGAGGTFTLTNVGSFGPLFGLPLINQPENAIMGAGKIVKRPVMTEDGGWGFRDMIYISLSFDHRVVDGALAGKFMSAIEYELANYDIDSLGLERRLT
ncbi:MAG: dihydrolipoamide acetyltransferase family protein [Planctomycetota bacterium]|jgi:2-oxoglutarate dehydrogenase E2 component (dihydrolipoamide succinyltransferase)